MFGERLASRLKNPHRSHPTSCLAENGSKLIILSTQKGCFREAGKTEKLNSFAETCTCTTSRALDGSKKYGSTRGFNTEAVHKGVSARGRKRGWATGFNAEAVHKVVLREFQREARRDVLIGKQFIRGIRREVRREVWREVLMQKLFIGGFSERPVEMF